jgi:hypothetical protein
MKSPLKSGVAGVFNSTIHANLLEQKWREFVEVLAPVDPGMATFGSLRCTDAEGHVSLGVA